MRETEPRVSISGLRELLVAGVAAAALSSRGEAPSVGVGERWAMSKHGIGFGRYHDIRFVEPTIKDRRDVLELVDGLVRYDSAHG